MNDIKSQKEEHDNSGATDHLPNGAVGAATLSAGLGGCVLGILAVIADGSQAVAHLLTFYLPTGPLSGVTSTAIMMWLITWAILARRWRAKTIAITKVNTVAFVLLALSLLLTFPPFADRLLGK
jgi:hypothetical protein